MTTITPTLNLAPPPASSTASTKAATATPPPAATPAPVPAPKAPDIPSTTVTLSPQAMSAMAAASHPSAPPSSSATSTTTAPAAAANDGSVYESLKNGIASAVGDVGDAIEGGAHAVVEGVETTISTANKVVQGILELPFAAAAKVCDAAGAIIDAV